MTPTGEPAPPAASRRGLFPAALVGDELEYEFVLPVPGRGPR